MSDEPEYLQRMRRAREERENKARGGKTPAPAAGALTREEQEVVRWAREAAKAEPRSVRNLSGAKFAVLIKLAGASGSATYALEGIESREALAARVKSALTMSEEVVGAYEVRSARPLTVTIENGEPTFKPGTPRVAVQATSPAQMLRRAEAEAVERAKQRPPDDRGRGRGGSGGGGGRGR